MRLSSLALGSALVVALGTASAPARADVTIEQLGRMLLGPNYVLGLEGYVNQHYLVWNPDPAPHLAPGYHSGIDYRATSPKPLYSPIDGVVGTWNSSTGALTIKKNGSNTRLVFLHLSGVNVSNGQNVQVGCRIGTTGNVGKVPYHLHIEAQIPPLHPPGHPYFPTLAAAQAVTKAPEQIPPSYVPVTNTNKACIP